MEGLFLTLFFARSFLFWFFVFFLFFFCSLGAISGRAVRLPNLESYMLIGSHCGACVETALSFFFFFFFLLF
jgi:hypothetical protein